MNMLDSLDALKEQANAASRQCWAFIEYGACGCVFEAGAFVD